MGQFFSKPEGEGSLAMQKKLPYEKPALRKLGAEEFPHSRKILEEFRAEMKALGKEPGQASFENYLKRRLKSDAASHSIHPQA